MTVEQFEKAVNFLKDSVNENHAIAACLVNHEDIVIYSFTCSCDWDDSMVYVSNLGIGISAFCISDVVNVHTYYVK